MLKYCVLLLLFSSSCYGIDTMTEELLKAQNELNIAFEFVELYLANQMDLWVGNMTFLNHDYFVVGFLKARSDIFDIIDDTASYINSFEESVCKNGVEERWNRQTSRVGSTLQTCMRILKGIAEQEFYETSIYHPDAQQLVAHTPNQGLNILSQNSIFEPPGFLHRLINRRLRELLGRATPWLLIMDELEEMLAHHIQTAKIMSQRCYDSVINNFRTTSDTHKELIRQC